MEYRAVLVNKTLTVGQDRQCLITLAEVTADHVLVRGRASTPDEAIELASTDVLLTDVAGREYPWMFSHVGGSGMEEIVYWIFKRLDETPLSRLSLTARTTVDLDLVST